MENPYAAPQATQADGQMGVDDVQLRRSTPHPDPSFSAFSLAWEKVKTRPVETILLAVLSTMFGNGRCGVQTPPNLDGLGETGGYDDSGDVDWGGGGGGYDDPYEYITNIDLQAMVNWIPGADMFGLPSLVGVGGAEIGFALFLFAFILAIAAVVLVIGVAIQAAEDIYWLRVVRGQHEDLGKSFSVGKYMIPIIVAQILVGLGTTFGLLLLIVPGLILSVGWLFVGLVAVDKNLGYVDALKASWRLTYGYKWDLVVMGLIAFGVSILGVLACCVGVFVSYAVIQGAFVIFYDRIAEPGNSYLADGESTGTGGFQGGSQGGNEPSLYGSDNFSSEPGPGPGGNGDPYGAQW